MPEIFTKEAKDQAKKEVLEAWTFLRKMNNTVPDEIIDLMKSAAEEKIDSMTEPKPVTIGSQKPECINAHYGNCIHWHNQVHGCWKCEKHFLHTM